ncbi:hypothetical protein DVH24_033496 [Malus domestica]|uniref:Uncharacterized protein n=1 Tax=Malus domestica TaxID=3750 RepID=A0A498JAV9_MALDO|nr:hypothetical protein DVH24_033496 [Malus domestica]
MVHESQHPSPPLYNISPSRLLPPSSSSPSHGYFFLHLCISSDPSCFYQLPLGDYGSKGISLGVVGGQVSSSASTPFKLVVIFQFTQADFRLLVYFQLFHSIHNQTGEQGKNSKVAATSEGAGVVLHHKVGESHNNKTLSIIFNNFTRGRTFSEVVVEAKQAGYTQSDSLAKDIGAFKKTELPRLIKEKSGLKS